MLDKVAMTFLLLGACTALMIVKDAFRRPAAPPVMNLTWLITGLYMPFIGWLAWWYFARQQGGRTVLYPHRPGLRRATAAGVFTSTSITASGGVAGAMLALALLPLLSHALPNSPRLCHALFSSLLALLSGFIVLTLYWRQAERLSWLRAMLRTLKSGLLSLVAWQLGMFLYFELALHFVLHGAVGPSLLPCWFMLQIAFFTGFIFSWPVNKARLEK
ncbi:hypothetical protein BTJ39_06925 [Izhakiella australiensis]|uniref:DUF4396 domain-containing protein n=1 Tax=Izhakiella australiensis TaxID=1926881 RepID=A0A1S8YPL8_9GAMM|nr:DUF4396 domain-containing protein [Izhakiella australiensis]OON40802.1 hypothetical protein BTJ39_06925 [Izhakiella australiensis]